MISFSFKYMDHPLLNSLLNSLVDEGYANPTYRTSALNRFIYITQQPWKTNVYCLLNIFS